MGLNFSTVSTEALPKRQVPEGFGGRAPDAEITALKSHVDGLPDGQMVEITDDKVDALVARIRTQMPAADYRVVSRKDDEVNKGKGGKVFVRRNTDDEKARYLANTEARSAAAAKREATRKAKTSGDATDAGGDEAAPVDEVPGKKLRLSR